METRQKKIIVPVDFSDHSRLAMRVGATFAAMHESELVLLHAVEPVSQITEFFAESNINERKREAAAKAMMKWEEELKGTGIEYSIMLEMGKPYKAIVTASEEILAEMIIMGTQGTEVTLEGFIGSNVSKVVRSADCPVITVNEEPANDNFSSLMLAVDYEFGIRELRRLLQQYHKVYNPTVDVVTVINPGKTEEGMRKKLTAYLQKQMDALHKQGIKDVKVHLLEGEIISETLINHANSMGHDMIWMETHGRKGISNLLMGSVTEEVIAHSKIPVLSLKPEREPDHTYYYHENLPI